MLNYLQKTKLFYKVFFILFLVVFLSSCLGFVNKDDLKKNNEILSKNSVHDKVLPFLYLSQKKIDENDFVGALEILQETIKFYPNSYLLYRQMAFIYIQLQDYDNALLNTEKTLKLNPNDLKSYYFMAVIKYAKNDSSEAKKILKRIISEDKDNYEANILLASLYYDDGKIDSALKVFQAILKKYPKSNLAHLCVAKIFMEKKKYKDALFHLEKGDSLSDKKEDKKSIRLILAEIYEMIGKNNKEKIELYQSILDVDFDNIKATSELAFLYETDSRYETAKKELFAQIALRILYEANFEKTFSIYLINKYMEKKDVTLLDSFFTELEKINFDHNKLYFFAGMVFYKLNLYDKAFECFDKVDEKSYIYNDVVTYKACYDIIVKQNNLSDAVKLLTSLKDKLAFDKKMPLQCLAYYYDKKEDYKNLIGNLEELNKRDKNNLEIIFNLAIAYSNEGSIQSQKKAEEKLKYLLEVDPDDAAVLNALGYLYAQMDTNLKKAETLVKKALEAEPENPFFLDSLAWIYYKKKDFKKALKFLQKSLKKAPEEEIILEHIGDVYMEMGLLKKAKNYYKLSVAQKETNHVQEKLKKVEEILIEAK